MAGIGIGFSPSLGNKIAWDADALAYIATAGITDQVEKSAANYFVRQFKIYGLWDKSIAIYPMLGGTASSHSYNLVDTSTFQITWVGSPAPTHSGGLGVQFDGTQNYGKTGIIPSVDMTIHSSALSAYSRTDLNNNGPSIGVSTSAQQQLLIQHRNAGNLKSIIYGSDVFQESVTDSIQLSTITKTSAASVQGFQRGVQVGATLTTAAGTLPTHELYLAALNSSGTAANFWGSQVPFAAIFSGLTEQESKDLDRIVEYVQS